ncbi:alkaline phosphatase-like [Harmonia axyridis]|uniref:alkaline phosphatase-like n=1 Tax=Harmonia axyridis TaxID=115357 RepID=UPI001E278208|nr:alkaline phosphatase-like [Harmonia axyridis]XP_045476357.1 alkaline phosphatase-like [Harmonia axyridis]
MRVCCAFLILACLVLLEPTCSFAAIRVPNGKNPTVHQDSNVNSREKTADYWYDIAQNFLEKAKLRKPNTNVAKNVILFLGDGMSVPTVTAARIYAGGESYQLSFEKFPYTGVSKTYCLDRMVSESTSTATAYLAGVKANRYTSGLTGAVKIGDCAGSLLPENQVPSIAAWSQKAGKWTGLVTTTRVTHASPAGLFSHTAHKEWESDADAANHWKYPSNCQDIARQLIENEVGSNFHVIMGGGRNKMIPKDVKDDEGKVGKRADGRNLIEEWQKRKAEEKKNYQYVWNRKQLLKINDTIDYLLGLFENDMCKYHVDRDPEMDPTLEEMTEAAIKILSKSPKGYFLFVEGGMIDQAHHFNKAGKALDETVEFAKAIRRATELTKEDDTLIVVTADHAHTMNIGGYPERGQDILKLSNFSDVLPIAGPVPVLTYANGPGFKVTNNGTLYNFTADNIDMDYQYPGLYKTVVETHGGDDVLIYAKGPWSHLFQGVMEQNTIPHLMAYASCVGSKSTACNDGFTPSSSSVFSCNFVIIYFSQLLLFFSYFLVKL